MSYGYPDSPFQSHKPPTSFGLPPGTPTPGALLNAPPNSHTPTSFGVPQPYNPYPNAYPSQSPLNPGMSSPFGMTQPSSVPQQSGVPQPPGMSQPPGIPQPLGMPQPSGMLQPSGMPQPSSMPYSSQNFSSSQPGYPPQPQAYPSYPSHYQPYSAQPPQHQSYPLQPSSHNQSYPSHTNSHPSHDINSTLYPNLNNIKNSDHITNPTTYNNDSPYLGGAYSGGQSNSGNFSHQGSFISPVPQMRSLVQVKLSPTVVPFEPFNPTNDAEVLRKAMKGFGTDEKAIIQILANRSNSQRLEIEAQYKTLYGKNLVKDLKSETSGNFEKLLVAMMTPLPQYYAKELHDAICGIGTDENVLIEILCTLSNHEIRVIKQAYESMFRETLEKDLMGDTSGNFKRLMVSLCCANRDETFEIDPAGASKDARALLKAGELRFGTDESVFNAILVQRNSAQLKLIFEEYSNITGHNIEKVIKKEFSGDIEKGLLAIVKCINNRSGFFAERIYKSMKGAGTKDENLIRLIVTRSEVDMGEIKQTFMSQYGKSLEDYISNDCSGFYKKCLLALVS